MKKKVLGFNIFLFSAHPNFQTLTDVHYLRSKFSNPFGKYFNYQLTLSFNCPFEYLKRVEDYFAN